MAYRELNGNLFASKAQALVNTVNCVGPMGKGIALEFRRRFPEMFEVYKGVCERRELRPGQILPYRKSKPWILNMAVKDDWKHPSKTQWVEQCLEKFCEWYPKVGLRSVAFPWMGAMNGRIPLDDIQRITRNYLEPLTDIDVEVYTFNSSASDPLFDSLAIYARTHSSEDLGKATKFRSKMADAVHALAVHPEITSLSQVVERSNLGKTSVDHLYCFLNTLGHPQNQKSGQQLSPEQIDLL